MCVRVCAWVHDCVMHVVVYKFRLSDFVIDPRIVTLMCRSIFHVIRYGMQVLTGMIHLVLVGLDSESEMIHAIEAACVDMFCNIIGGVVFTNLPSDGKTLPKDIEYKVRIRLYSYGELSSMQTVLPYMKFQNPRKYEAGGKCMVLVF